ncbi:MAG: type II toxin-antitoxin system HicB family antitoxin [Bacteriovoracia bacterium]
MKELKHKGYQGIITSIDYKSGYIHGEVLLLRDVVTFKATSPKKLAEEFKESVEEYLRYCKEDGVDPSKPLKGEVLIRCGKEIQQEIIKHVASRKAKGEKLSQNDWCIAALKEKLSREVPA